MFAPTVLEGFTELAERKRIESAEIESESAWKKVKMYGKNRNFRKAPIFPLITT
jgi:hypothetical protein